MCDLMTCHSKMIGQKNSKKAVAAMHYSLLTLRDEIEVRCLFRYIFNTLKTKNRKRILSIKKYYMLKQLFFV